MKPQWCKLPGVTMLAADARGWLPISKHFRPEAQECAVLREMLVSLVRARQFKAEDLAVQSGPGDSWRMIVRRAA